MKKTSSGRQFAPSHDKRDRLHSFEDHERREIRREVLAIAFTVREDLRDRFPSFAPILSAVPNTRLIWMRRFWMLLEIREIALDEGLQEYRQHLCASFWAHVLKKAPV